MKLRRATVLLMAVAGLAAACGGNPASPPLPSPSPTPPPAPSPTPPPAPTPTPCPPPCEEPTTNTNVPVRLTLRLYAIEDGAGGFQQIVDPELPIPTGRIARIDVTGKDVNNRETNGKEPVEFHFSKPELVEVIGNHTHQRRLKILKQGVLECWATQHGVRSNNLRLTFFP